jgi:tRNA threonylcarbamoyladenosine biosynthesis protein TsaE
MHEVDIRDGKVISLSELDEAVEELINVCRQFRIWLFSGDLGAGKTTLILTICRHLGVIDKMSSPTFSIIHEYATSDHSPIYHFDFYRLKNEQEAFDLGIEEYFDSGSYCFVEWPEKIPSLIPPRRVEITIKHQDTTHRTIRYTTHE